MARDEGYMPVTRRERAPKARGGREGLSEGLPPQHCCDWAGLARRAASLAFVKGAKGGYAPHLVAISSRQTDELVLPLTRYFFFSQGCRAMSLPKTDCSRIRGKLQWKENKSLPLIELRSNNQNCSEMNVSYVTKVIKFRRFNPLFLR